MPSGSSSIGPGHFPDDWGRSVVSIRSYRKNPSLQHASHIWPSSSINKPVTCVDAIFLSISRTTAHANSGARVVSGRVPSSSSLKTATHPSAGIMWRMERLASLILDIVASFPYANILPFQRQACPSFSKTSPVGTSRGSLPYSRR